MTSPGDISNADFRRTLRGYDPDEVHAFLGEVAARMEVLERQNAAALQRLTEYGEGDRTDQIDQLTEDINRILRAAQATAENLRTRTEAEVADVRSRAERAVHEMLAAAEADAYNLRKDAWEAGTKLLEDVAEYVAATRKHADAEALEIIGEAERTAHRKLATARRDAENQLRAARLEGERIRVEAQAERDELLENAHRAAETAQERARALERRRDELLADIERLQLEGTPNMTVEPASTTVRVVRPGEGQPAPDADESIRIVKPPAPASWADGTENVRVVEPPAKPPVEFLDGETIADEVRKLRDTEEIPAVDDVSDQAQPAAKPATRAADTTEPAPDSADEVGVGATPGGGGSGEDESDEAQAPTEATTRPDADLEQEPVAVAATEAPEPGDGRGELAGAAPGDTSESGAAVAPEPDRAEPDRAEPDESEPVQAEPSLDGVSQTTSAPQSRQDDPQPTAEIDLL